MSLLLFAEAWGLSFFWVPGYPPNSFENFEVFIPMEMNRRTLAKGAAWAAPVVVASAAVPAYAASQEPCSTGGSFIAPAPSDGNGATSTWTVPAGVNSICFTVLGAAGGAINNLPGGAGAQVTGILPVTPGDVLTLVVGSGGVSEKASWARAGASGFGSAPAIGGKGYGDGGDAADIQTTEPNDLDAKDKRVRVQRFGASGGAGSAILLNGQPVVIAGGGGGAGTSPTFASLDNTSTTTWRGAETKTSNSPTNTSNTSLQQAGSAGGSAADASGTTVRTSTAVAAVAGETYNFGSGAKAGAAGVGGASGPNDISYNGSSMIIKKQEYVAGGAGESVAAPGPAKGGSGAALDVSYYIATVEGEPDDKAPVARLINIGGGGGGGYGGGGAGSVSFFGTTYSGQPETNFTGEARFFGGAMSTSNPGAAGGSYLAPSVNGGVIAQGNNTNSTPGGRNHGAISFTF